MESPLQLSDLFLLLGTIFPLQSLTNSPDIGRNFGELDATAQCLIQHPTTETQILTIINDLLQCQKRFRISRLTHLLRPSDQTILLIVFHLLKITFVDRPVTTDRILISVRRPRILTSVLNPDLRIFQHFFQHRLLTEITDIDTYRIIYIPTLGYLP